MKLRVGGGLVRGDGPPAPPARPVICKIAQGRLAPNLDRAVLALDGTLDTPRGKRIPGVQRRRQQPRDVPRAVGQADLAVADEDRAEGVRPPDAPDQLRRGEVVPVLGRAAQALDVPEVEVLQDDDLDLVGQGREVPGWLLLRWRLSAPDREGRGVGALTDGAPSSKLLEPWGGGRGLEVPLAACRR